MPAIMATQAPSQGRPPETNHGPRPPFPDDLTILDMLRQHATHTPDALALVLTEGEGLDGTRREVTYREMWDYVAQIARTLRHAGACSGSRWVMIVLPEGLQQVCAVWGVIGLVFELVVHHRHLRSRSSP